MSIGGGQEQVSLQISGAGCGGTKMNSVSLMLLLLQSAQKKFNSSAVTFPIQHAGLICAAHGLMSECEATKIATFV